MCIVEYRDADLNGEVYAEKAFTSGDDDRVVLKVTSGEKAVLNEFSPAFHRRFIR